MTDPDALPVNPPRNRLVGPMPKIGIRPAIDGRRKGVRESLEAQTLAMAGRVAEFLTGTLRHANGLPVECVFPESCIGGAAEAAKAAELFAREGVGVSITVTPCWCYGSETMDMDPFLPKAVWGFNGTERPGAVYLAAVLAGHNQKGLPAFGIYGRDVQDAGDTTIPADVREKLLAVRARRPRGRDDARQILPLDGRRFDGHRRFDRRSRASSKATWGCASKAWICRSSCAGSRNASSIPRNTPGRFSGRGSIAARAASSIRRKPSAAGNKRTRIGRPS